MTTRTHNRIQSRETRTRAGRRHAHRTTSTPGNLHSAATENVLDFALIREVQMKATGANIHRLAQQLQIYVSAVECGAILQAQTVEAQLRTWLAANSVRRSF